MSDSFESAETFATRRGTRSSSAVATRLTWFLIGLSILLLLRFVVPYFVEQLQYANTRGKQRAEYEMAGKSLDSLKLDELSKAYQLVSQRVAPSVVNIQVASVVEVPPDDLSALFGSRQRESQGQGSGVIVDAAGFVLTNNHVVANATEIQVSLADGRNVSARIVGVDPLTDLAVLKLNADHLTAAEWGDSEKLEVGALVWAVGSPYGLQHSITAGIVSGKNRQGIARSVFHDFLQTDAAVNPGNSGGPLVDTRGRVVGINTAILGESYQGISFAIPANEAHAVYERLKSEGRIARGWLGVQLVDIDANIARDLRLPADQGVLVRGVQSGTPAHKAGVQPGDIVVSWNGLAIQTSTVLSRMVARTKIGETVPLIVIRNGAQVSLAVTVEERPADR